MFKLLFVFLISGCALSVSYKPTLNTDLLDACREFCGVNVYQLLYRNETTHFCECYDDENNIVKSCVVGNNGTVYK